MQGWTCLPDTEEVQDARVSLQVSGKQPFQNAFTFHCYIFTQDLRQSSLAKPCSYKCILHQQLECKLIQTREDPRLFVLSLFAIILNCTYTYLYYLLLICVFLCFPWDPSRSRLPDLQPQCGRTCSPWPSTLLLVPWKIPNLLPGTMKMARRQRTKRRKQWRKTAWSTFFFTSQSRIMQITHLAHVCTCSITLALDSFSHPFRYVSCIQVSIAVIDSDWSVSFLRL